MPAPLLLDLSHTSHTRALTGIQRVARSLRTALGDTAVPVTFDPYLRAWRPLQPWEEANLTGPVDNGSRSARWPLQSRIGGRVRRWLHARDSAIPTAAGIVVPELFSRAVGASIQALRRRTTGPAIAVFHDAIALKLPELMPPKTVARFPAYLLELLQFDGIAAVSEDSRQSLLEYWQWLGVAAVPPVAAIPLGVDAPTRTGPTEHAITGTTPTVLCVSSIEGRKNHMALFEACERLWASGARFELRIVGLARPETGQRALDEIARLRAAGRPLRYDGAIDDGALSAAYAECAFTVYPSVLEGFGLPVLESVARGKPCICSAGGALGEAAAGGGCLTLPAVDADTLAGAIGQLVREPAKLTQLSTEAKARILRTWSEYACALRDWMQTLPHRTS